MLVLLSVVVGANLASRDDSVALWVADRDIAAGDRITDADLRSVRVSLADAEIAAGYLLVDEALPEHRHVITDLAAGQLVPRTSLASAVETALWQVPIWTSADAVPPHVSAGSVVDVWVAGTDDADARLLLSGVTVISAPRGADGFAAPSGARQLVLAVPYREQEAVAAVIAAAVRGGVVVVGRE